MTQVSCHLRPSFIEVWFSILSRKCLRPASFAVASVAFEQIVAFIVTYNTHRPHPFEWRKGVRFYQRLKDRIGAASALHLGGNSQPAGDSSLRVNGGQPALLQ